MTTLLLKLLIGLAKILATRYTSHTMKSQMLWVYNHLESDKTEFFFIYSVAYVQRMINLSFLPSKGK